MPEIAQATITVTPVLDGAQNKLTNELTGIAGPAGDKAGTESGSKFAGSFTKSLIGGTVAVTTAVAGTGAALIGAANNTAEYGDNIDKMSQKLGLSAEAYQTWDYILGQSGTDIDKMAVGMKTLTNKLDDAKNGSADAQAMFAKLGLSMEDLQGMSREEVFEAAITGFQGMADSTERAALANDLFGKSGQELTPLFNTSVEETEALKKASEDLGFVLSNDAVKASADYVDSLDTMQRTFSGVGNGLMVELLPPLTDFMTKIADFIANTDLSPVTDTIGSAVTALGDFISGLDIEAAGQAFGVVVEGIGAAVSIAWDVVSTIFDSLQTGFDTIAGSLTDVGIDWDDVWNGISDVMQTVADLIGSAIELIADTIAWLITEAQTEGTYFNTVWENIQTAVSTAADVIQGVIDTISALLKGDWEGAWESAKGVVDTYLDGISKICENTWNFIKDTAETVWEGIKSAIEEPVKNLKETVAGVWDAVSSKASEIWNGIRDTVTGVFDTIKNHISPIVDWLKGIFDFKWSLPDITLPHIAWHWHDIGGFLSIPVFDGIDWYAKGGIFDDASLIGVGEAGREAVVPLEGAAMRPFAKAIAEEMSNAGGDIYNNNTVNVYATEGMDINQLARKVSEELAFITKQQQSAWGAA